MQTRSVDSVDFSSLVVITAMKGLLDVSDYHMSRITERPLYYYIYARTEQGPLTVFSILIGNHNRRTFLQLI